MSKPQTLESKCANGIDSAKNLIKNFEIMKIYFDFYNNARMLVCSTTDNETVTCGSTGAQGEGIVFLSKRFKTAARRDKQYYDSVMPGYQIDLANINKLFRHVLETPGNEGEKKEFSALIERLYVLDKHMTLTLSIDGLF